MRFKNTLFSAPSLTNRYLSVLGEKRLDTRVHKAHELLWKIKEKRFPFSSSHNSSPDSRALDHSLFETIVNSDWVWVCSGQHFPRKLSTSVESARVLLFSRINLTRSLLRVRRFLRSLPPSFATVSTVQNWTFGELVLQSYSKLYTVLDSWKTSLMISPLK